MSGLENTRHRNARKPKSVDYRAYLLNKPSLVNHSWPGIPALYHVPAWPARHDRTWGSQVPAWWCPVRGYCTHHPGTTPTTVPGPDPPSAARPSLGGVLLVVVFLNTGCSSTSRFPQHGMFLNVGFPQRRVSTLRVSTPRD